MKFGQSSPLSSAHYPCLLRCCASSQSQEWRRWCRTLVRCKKKTTRCNLGMFEPPLPNMGVSLNGGFSPQNIPTWSVLVGKPMVVGETHHFRKPPYRWDVGRSRVAIGLLEGWAAGRLHPKIMPHPTSANRVLICAENLLHITLKHGGDHATRLIYMFVAFKSLCDRLRNPLETT